MSGEMRGVGEAAEAVAMQRDTASEVAASTPEAAFEALDNFRVEQLRLENQWLRMQLEALRRREVRAFAA